MTNLGERLITWLEDNPYAIITCGHFMIDEERCYYSFQGAILLVAGYSLQGTTEDYRLPLNAPHIYKTWLKSESRFTNSQRDIEISALARQVWEDAYGEEHAAALPFHGDEHEALFERGEFYWESIKYIDSYDVRAFLKGNNPSGLKEKK